MKKLLSVLVVAIMLASALSGVALAGNSSDGNVLIREYVPGVDSVTTGSTQKLGVTTVTDGEESYYQYESLTGASDAPLGYIQLTSSITELTFMLTDAGSSLGFMPTFYDDNKNSTDKYSYTQIIKIAENGVVITNIKDSTEEYLFEENDIRWVNHKFTLVPNISLNEKHTVRIEHDPDNLRFALWFDSNKVTLTENALSAYVESCVTGADGAVNAKGPRFLFPATKGQTFRVYDMYIRGTQATNKDNTETAKVFSGARAYTFEGDSADNVFGYYKGTDGNTVITGFKNDVVPAGEYTEENPLVFPSSINGSPVTKIADYAFNQDADGDKTKETSKYTGYANITAITLPDTLKTIGLHSMTGFKNLAKIEIPDSVELIDDYAFAYIYNTEAHTPKSIKFGSSLKTIGSSAFYSCGYLCTIKELVIPASVETIESSAFVLCHVLDVIFEGAPTIGSYVFRNQIKLQNVVCLNENIVFGDKAFGLDGTQGNESTVTDGFTVVGAASVYDKVKASNAAAGFPAEDVAKVTYADNYVYKTASVPAVYYWGTDSDAKLIKAKYNSDASKLESCSVVSMTAGNSYPLELASEEGAVKNFVWTMGDCKPLNKSVNY